MDPPYGGSVIRTVTTTPNKTRQWGHAIATLSLATTYFYVIHLFDAIVTSFVVLYRPPCNALPITSISTRFLSGTLDLLLLVAVGARCPPLSFLDPVLITTVR